MGDGRDDTAAGSENPAPDDDQSRRDTPAHATERAPTSHSSDRPTEDTTTATADTRVDPEQYVTDRRSLSPKIQVLWAIRAGITALVLGLITGFALTGLNRDPRYGAVVALTVLVLGAVWVVLYYRIWVYQIRDDAIYLERGVVTHVRTLVPYVRIQHVDTSRGPIERLLGLSTLVVYTAGSRGADVSIPGLTPEEASDLQQRVKRLAIEAEGDDAL
jgi:membrane protein YdbS with pleckstrin-like domain